MSADVLDVIIAAVAAAAAVGGYRLGFLGRVASWAGLALGFYVAVRVLPPIIVHLRNASAQELVIVAVAILVGGAMIGQALGLIAGSRLHRFLPLGPLRLADRAVGGVVGVAGVFAVLWLLIPSLAAVPGWPAREVSGSAISRWVSGTFPAPPDALEVLRRLVGNNAPQVFAVLQPGFSSGPPPAAVPLSPAVVSAVEASTVKVEGQACSEILEGSGFAVAHDLIMTNAHVVAGEPPGQTSVMLPSGRILPATVVMFDPRIDLALLSVRGLGENPLPLATPQVGESGAVFGHPEGQDPIAVSPARVSQDEEAVGRDLYDTQDVKRNILVLASTLQHGDSGGPLVSTGGQVVGVAFAISADQPDVAYALAESEVVAALGEARSASAPTGACLAGG